MLAQGVITKYTFKADAISWAKAKDDKKKSDDKPQAEPQA